MNPRVNEDFPLNKTLAAVGGFLLSQNFPTHHPHELTTHTHTLSHTGQVAVCGLGNNANFQRSSTERESRGEGLYLESLILPNIFAITPLSGDHPPTAHRFGSRISFSRALRFGFVVVNLSLMVWSVSGVINRRSQAKFDRKLVWRGTSGVCR